MSVKNYRFVSPGVFVNEIDNSQLPASPAGIGPVLIGRAEKGPALRPVTVSSFAEFVNVFGTPAPGGAGNDVWREGTDKTATTYGMYGAQAYLRNSSPLTYVRLLGDNAQGVSPDAAGAAGWNANDAWGLVVFEQDSSTAAVCATGSLSFASGAIAVGETLTLPDVVLTVISPTGAAGPGTIQIGASDNEFAANALTAINFSSSVVVAVDHVGPDPLLVTSASTCGAAGDSILLESSQVNGIRVNPLDGGAAVGTGSLSGGVDATHGFDGALAAIFYGTEDDVTFELSGNVLHSLPSDATPSVGDATQSADVIVQAVGPGKEFKLVIGNYDGATDLTTTFNFNRADSRYIRKVFNTNPQLTNGETTAASAEVEYFLGETFDRHLEANVEANTQADTFAAIVKLSNGTEDGANHKAPLQSAQTPHVISCKLDPSEDPTNLFQIVALDEPGDWSNRNIKVSIQDVKRSTNESTEYGTFSVVVRHLSDSDNVVRVIEQFNNCDLNPDSVNYVARKIGTQTRVWDDTERRYRTEGDWPNNSAYIRLAMNSNVDAGLTNAALLPFGFRGITKYEDESDMDSAGNGNWIVSSVSAPAGYQNAGPFYASGSALTASVVYPAPELRVSASDGNLSNPTDAYFGFQTARTPGSTVFAQSTIDLVRPRGGIVGNMFVGTDGTLNTDTSVLFTLDDISGSAGVWVQGASGSTSLTAVNGAVSGVLDAGFDRFTVPVYGGFDGVNVTDMDAFANINIGTSDTNSYTFNSIRRAIDSVADPEVVEMNLASVPGLTNDGLTTHLVRTCEDRADALAVIDLPDAFQPRAEGQEVDRLNESSTITTLINGLRSRALNSSYGCTYYPWVRARDTINGAFVWLPPSIPAIGTFSSSQRKTQVWFAPAGFNRGGLTEGSAGIPVVDVAHQLRRKDRDDLYTANINPIAKFPAEGIVIFGQKTLQVTPSALDRINVRRLMIFVKKRISQIASGLLFEPNVKQTWLRFKGQVDPFLANVKTNFGLTDYKVVLDDTTTTPELVDRNILYAKIYLKPARAIEFIAIDFNITRTGASFDD
jgi:hypothetical protein